MKYKLVRKSSSPSVSAATKRLEPITCVQVRSCTFLDRVQREQRRDTREDRDERAVPLDFSSVTAQLQESEQRDVDSGNYGQELYVTQDHEKIKQSRSYLKRIRILPTRKRATKPKQHETFLVLPQNKNKELPANDEVQQTSSQPSHPSVTFSPIVKANDQVVLTPVQAEETVVSAPLVPARSEPPQVVAGNATIQSVPAFDEEDTNRSRHSANSAATAAKISTIGWSKLSTANLDSIYSSDDDDDEYEYDNTSVSVDSYGEEDQTVLIDSATAAHRKVDDSWYSGFRMVLPTLAMASYPQDTQEENPEPDEINRDTSLDTVPNPEAATPEPVFFNASTIDDSGNADGPQLPQQEIGLEDYQRTRRADSRRKWFRLLTLQGLSVKRSSTTKKRQKEPNSTFHSAMEEGKNEYSDHHKDDSIRHQDHADVTTIRTIDDSCNVERNQKPSWRPRKAMQHVGISVKRRFHRRNDQWYSSEDESSRSQYSDVVDSDDYYSLSAYSKALESQPMSQMGDSDDDDDDAVDDDVWGYLMSFWNPRSQC
jgi:hypothetical protein